jgi:hypothetical protein
MNDDNDLQFHSEPDVHVHARRMETQEVRTYLALQMLKQVQESLAHVIQLIEVGNTQEAHTHMLELVSLKKEVEHSTGIKTVQGIFDGASMVGSDGVRYEVPTNYASKSRLVEGDELKLTIGMDGSYTFKQIGPVDRQRLVGMLAIDESTQEPVACCGQKRYKLLEASVTYFKGIPGDQIVVLVPRDDTSVWAAVETIVRA